MRLFFIGSFILLTSILSLAQSKEQRAKSTTYSASSAWQKVTLKSTTRLAINKPVPVPPVSQPVSLPTPTAESALPNEPNPSRPLTSDVSTFRPAFTGDFATNRNGWKAGIRGDYYYEIGQGRYSMRKRKANTQQVAFSSIELPTNINLNRAEIFTIRVDILADSGQIPRGGLVFGVKDSLNYCSFAINEKGQVSIKRVADGRTFSDYMPGDFFAPGIPIDKNRNRLTIQKQGDELHFYVNAQEIRSSPYPFKMLSGNGFGMIASAYWTAFQKLSVTVGL